MAWPAPTYGVATYDKTSGTFDTSVDSKLWPALMARSPLLAMIGHEPTDEIDFYWETANEPTRIYTEANSSDTSVDGSGSATALVVSSAAGLEKGALIRNATRATPIGTYGADEIMQVTAISGTTCTVTRDYARQNSGTGSTAHALTDTYEVIATPKPEGSSPDANKYKDVTKVGNYVQSFDFELEVTYDQLKSKRLVVADTLQAQTAMGMQKLRNELESTLLYGALNYGGAGTHADAWAGSDSYVRSTKGAQNFIYVSGANVDYATKAVTEDALNTQFAAIVMDKTDPMDKFAIVCHPAQARIMSHFGEDVVRTTQESTVWGRSIQTFKSDLGIEAPIIWTLNCSQSDLFILDLNKIKIMDFEGFKTATRTYETDGIDSWRQRVLGKYGVKVVDATKSHAALGYLTWVA